MLPNNTNFSPSLNESVIIMYDTNILISTCTNIISNQILVHFLSVGYFSSILCILAAQLMFMKRFFCLYENNHTTMNDISTAEHKCHHMVAIIKGELLILFFYSLFAFLYNWLWLMKGLNNITLIHFIRWFIEATSIPLIIFVSYTGIIDSWIIENEPGAHMTGVIMLKIPIFLLARYAETDPDAGLNFLRKNFFFLICNLSNSLFE